MLVTSTVRSWSEFLLKFATASNVPSAEPVNHTPPPLLSFKNEAVV